MNGFEKRAQRIREKIIRTTLTLLRTNEPKRIRVADIAKAAGVSQVTIYNYFGSKEVLLREAFIDRAERIVAEFEEFMNENRSMKEKFERILHHEREFYKEFPLTLLRQMLAEDPELTRYFEQQYQEKTLPVMKRIIEEGQRNGEIPEDISVEVVLIYIQTFMSQFVTLLDRALQSEDTDRFMQEMARIFFYGVCGKP